VNPATGRAGKEKLDMPPGLLEFQTEKDGVIPVMSRADQNESCAWIGEKRLQGHPSPLDCFPH
jgi:hypothetical protein